MLCKSGKHIATERRCDSQHTTAVWSPSSGVSGSIWWPWESVQSGLQGSSITNRAEHHPKHLRFIIPLILGGFLAIEHSETCCFASFLVTVPKCAPQSETIADLRSKFRSIWEGGSFIHSSPCCSTLFSASVSFTSALLYLFSSRSVLRWRGSSW